ncbi:hypothetical protein AU196_20155 [Mycobacterium sp. IS-1742]|uniref:sunset domain-containing protein n=1 Tax=Mycobacterium sp. IS-1742 TaxID=1772285 RepID=UPI00073FF264|nr:hypothetical protein [Mycobacterium sp. IS-1742]KUI24220.1 hypothetical protein AU196_20155 [Mycobacterium sp. IS-1742]
MSGRRPLLHTALARVTIGLAVAAAGLFSAPLAAADPATEANDAITAAYDGSGGPTGPLGVREGGVYPVGDGFGQNFAAGKMFFTPATGAHWMQGAVLEKYESLGGPADSDLGFPTIDEGPGRVGPDSRNATFSATDKPVIFWTPATGARVVRGAINAAWDRLGGSAGVLGVPAEDEVYRGDVASQKFTGGQLSWNRKDKTFTTVPPDLAGQLKDLSVPQDATSAIAAARRAAGGALGPLGAKDGDQYEIGDDGVGQNYAGGKIFYTPQTGANVVTGQVLEKYESVGGPAGDLGFPTNSEADGGLGSNSRISTFAAEDKPVIFWTPDYGAVIVRGAMNAGWSKLDGAKGPLGAPTADQTENGDVVTQRFSDGVLSYDRSTGRFSTEPANLAPRLAGLEVPGEEVPKSPAQPESSAAEDDGKWLSWRWNWWWLLALIPVLLVVGLVAGAVLWRRRRGDREDQFRDDQFRDDRDVFADAARYRPDGGPAASAGPWGPPDDSGDEALAAERSPGPDGLFGGQDDPDSIDTAPTRIEAPVTDEARAQSALEEPSLPAPALAESAAGGATAPEPAGDEWIDETPENETPEAEQPEAGESAMPAAFMAPFVDDAPSGRHAAIDIEEPTPGRTAIQLAGDASGAPPPGYPVKADTKTGLYWAPFSPGYDQAIAEIYFASEEFARTNGFVRGD